MGEHIRAVLKAPGRALAPQPLVRNLKQIGRSFRLGRQARMHAATPHHTAPR